MWNVANFARIVPHDPRGRVEETIDDIVNFGRDLHIPTTKSPEKHLLREEYDWLLAQNLNMTSESLTDWLSRCRDQVFDRT
jgi:hypothetical protein